MLSSCCAYEILSGDICSRCGEPCDGVEFVFEVDEEAGEIWLLDENGDRYDPNNDLNSEADEAEGGMQDD